MSDPGNGTGMALAYIREELAGLSTRMDNALGGVRADLAALAGELRGYINEHGPAFAVIQHRLSEVEKDLASLATRCDATEKAREAADKEREQMAVVTRRDRVQQRWALVVAFVSAILAWVLPLLAK